ncbi:DNA-methyltransferase [Roseospira navarrensis]|uniref:Methyltransferase n=1 Tax=Roseospira navarrensis TaxID=140058 RepID=A0A7X2D5U7_9PROT|nr:site-specific DNA-methyltransferase [Roseospira navarrensis]MQX37615.1 site-specific DNA-methyltransferase [Roseospira navarrensis]
MARPKAEDARDSFASVRLTASERKDMEQTASRLGFKSLSEYVRHLHSLIQADESDHEQTREELTKRYPWRDMALYYKTDLGTMLHGNSLNYLFSGIGQKSVDLIMTSPPFGLVRKKTYGNEDAHHYCDWFRPFAEGFRRVLKDSGSLVIDIGGAWKPGTPTRSLYHFELLLMLCEEYGFHLCEEHYWWNPSKLPTPAEWVNVRRVRVKDAVNCVWWLSPTPWPKANNRRVLAPYSDSMRGLLKNGYTAKLRPSGHDISDKFGKDNGGSVPPNLLAVANTESNGRYQDYCRDHGYPIHPARFPEEVPEYFIRFLTDPGDLVVDPFAGSCVTGAVAEALGRRWTCCELEEDYLKGAMARFKPNVRALDRSKAVTYTINPPCSVPVDEEVVPLVEDGGATRPEALLKNKRSNRSEGRSIDKVAAE